MAMCGAKDVANPQSASIFFANKAKIKLGKQDCVELGNMEAQRDWGYAKEYVHGMWLMMQQDKPETYVLASGRTQNVRDFVDMMAKAVGTQREWQGEGQNEVGIEAATGKVRVRVNPRFYRPAEVELLLGNPEKARQDLGWQAKTSLEDLCSMMVEADLQRNSLICHYCL